MVCFPPGSARRHHPEPAVVRAFRDPHSLSFPMLTAACMTCFKYALGAHTYFLEIVANRGAEQVLVHSGSRSLRGSRIRSDAGRGVVSN